MRDTQEAQPRVTACAGTKVQVSDIKHAREKTTRWQSERAHDRGKSVGKMETTKKLCKREGKQETEKEGRRESKRDNKR